MADSPRVYFLYTTIGANDRGQKSGPEGISQLNNALYRSDTAIGIFDRPATIGFGSRGHASRMISGQVHGNAARDRVVVQRERQPGSACHFPDGNVSK